MRRETLISISAFCALGCASGPCRGKSEWPEKKAVVYKPDGSRQCEKKGGVSLDAMATELKDIRIYSQSKKDDGLVRMQVCGAPTGKINAYEIRAEDIEAAVKLGFKELKNDDR